MIPHGVNQDRLPRLPARALDGLSKREREVYDLLVQKFSTAQVAQKMSISPHTVTSHLKMIRLKFKVRGYI